MLASKFNKKSRMGFVTVGFCALLISLAFTGCIQIATNQIPKSPPPRLDDTIVLTRCDESRAAAQLCLAQIYNFRTVSGLCENATVPALFPIAWNDAIHGFSRDNNQYKTSEIVQLAGYSLDDCAQVLGRESYNPSDIDINILCNGALRQGDLGWVFKNKNPNYMVALDTLKLKPEDCAKRLGK